MFLKCCHFVILVVVYLQLKGAASFFVKEAYQYGRGRCINVTGQSQSSGSWGNLFFLEFSPGSCLDPSAQFRFRDNGAMLNLERQGCLAALNKNGSSYDLDMFYLYVDSVSLDTAACAQKPSEGIYRAITQTSNGGLSVYYKGRGWSSFRTWCAYWSSHYELLKNYNIEYYIGLWTSCYSYYNKLIFGSATCYGDKVKNANCPKDQYMVVKIASFRGLLGTKICGLSDDYTCEVDVTCLVKKKCDGLYECSFTVDNSFVSGDLCPGLSNYLYFEYQCVDTVEPFNDLCVHDVSLSYSTLPYKGVVQITTDDGTENVCWGSLSYWAKRAVCRHLGYDGRYYYAPYFLVNVSIPTDAKEATFSGSISCDSGVKFLSQCSISASDSKSCYGLSYINCTGVPSWSRYKPLLENKERVPDSSFSASASVKGHSPSDARITIGSSWCAPVSGEKHYLQIDFGRMYYLYFFVTYGDSTSTKWVAKYYLNYTVDFLDWKTVNRIYPGNKNAYDQAGFGYLYVDTRSLRFISSAHVGQPCMRVEIWGEIALADKPTNLTITAITSQSAIISWQNPKFLGKYGFTNFRIELKKDKKLILGITTPKVNKYKIKDLTPYSTYEISVAVEHYSYGFDDGDVSSFSTSEEAPNGPPLNIRTTTRSASSLSFAWDPPETSKQNGVITNCTACVSRSENGPCFQTLVTNESSWVVKNLKESTRYYIRVFASTKVGHGNYSESKGFFTSANINECENASLCQSGYECVNTIGSYRCEREMPDFETYRLELRLNEDYTNELNSNTSSKFMEFKERMEMAMEKVHENNDAYSDVQILNLREGSIIAELLLIFSKDNTKGVSELFDAIRNNSFGDFPVDPDALTVIMIGTCPSDECPGNSTCKQLTSETISCPCNEGYYYDGVSCLEFTVINVEVALDKVFTKDLENSSSEAFIKLAENITAALREKFKDTPNFQDVRVVRFRNGSTVVEFVVIYRQDKETKVIVAKEFRKDIIDTGKLGGYEVIRGFVKGTPPAPEELKHTHVTDNRIEITWKKPIAHLAFVINGYAIGHKTTAETNYKMEKFNSNTTNSVLSNLESDTLYDITIHAYNDDGSGEKLRIAVTTEKSSSNLVVIIIVVVIVVVLLLIIGMVVVFQIRKRRYRAEIRQQAHAQRQMPTTMKLAAIPPNTTHYDNYGQGDEEGQSSKKL